MTYFLLAVMLLLCTINAPQPVGAATTLSVNIALNPGETYANAWAAAGTPSVVALPCGPYPYNGVKSTTGSKVECPTGASTGVLKSATGTNGDRATASAWAQISSSGVGTANAPVNIPLKPQAYAGAAAYAKANSAVPKEVRGSGKVGGIFTITYGNLTVNGWSEPADAVTYIVFDDSPRGQLSNMLTKVLDEDSIESLKEEGYTFAQPTNVYFMIPIVLLGTPNGKPKMGKPFYFKEDLQKCPTIDILQRFKEKMKEPCLISEQSPSEKDFMPCQGRRCSSDELNYSLDRAFEVKFYIPGVDLTENVSVHEISCVKSRDPNQSALVKNDDICSLALRIPHGQSNSHGP